MEGRGGGATRSVSVSFFKILGHLFKQSLL